MFASSRGPISMPKSSPGSMVVKKFLNVSDRVADLAERVTWPADRTP
jgi:hypothetical protein